MLVYSSVIDAGIEEVFEWHRRPGALSRLSPPWLPVKVCKESSSLSDGTAELGLPGGLRWVARHDPGSYDPPNCFVDELVTNAPLRWRHTHVFTSEGAGKTRLEDRVDTTVPAALLRQMFAYRHRQLAGDMAAHGRWGSRNLTVAVTGSSGLIGSALVALLTTGGHHVVRLVRRAPSSPDERRWDTGHPSPSLLEGADAVVHLAGASIAGRFGERHKAVVRESRIGPTRMLAQAAAAAGVPTFVTASAIGYYGYDRGDELLTESSPKGHGFLADLVEEWEAATGPASSAGCRVVTVRTGIVQSPRGGALGVMYPVFLAGLGGKLGSGRQWTSWVGADDLVDIYYRAIVSPDLTGPVNATSPDPVTNAVYTSTLAHVLRRPALMTVPTLATRLLLGEEGSREVAEASQRVSPLAGQPFRQSSLETALRHVLGRWEL